MQLSNGTEVTVRRYRTEDAEEIVNLIIRNFKEVNVKDYGEEAVKALVATLLNGFKVLQAMQTFMFFVLGN